MQFRLLWVAYVRSVRRVRSASVEQWEALGSYKYIAVTVGLPHAASSFGFHITSEPGSSDDTRSFRYNLCKTAIELGHSTSIGRLSDSDLIGRYKHIIEGNALNTFL